MGFKRCAIVEYNTCRVKFVDIYYCVSMEIFNEKVKLFELLQAWAMWGSTDWYVLLELIILSFEIDFIKFNGFI